MEFTLKFKEDGNFEMELKGVICDKEYDPITKKWAVIYPDDEIVLFDSTDETN